LNLAINASYRVEVPIKTTPPPKGGEQVNRMMLPTSV
jgi:hypothetical protein